MPEKLEPLEKVASLFDAISGVFDTWLETLQAKVYGEVTWQHLQHLLPELSGALVLDAGGGTGRWTLPLAGKGYRVVLCDISPGMLRQACDKIRREDLTDRAWATLQNLENLAFAGEIFDFVLCEDGPLSICDAPKALGEMVRVLKPGGMIWAAVAGRFALSLRRLQRDFEEAVALATGARSFTRYKGLGNTRVFSPAELRELFVEQGLEVIAIYGNGIATGRLAAGMQDAAQFDEALFRQVSELERQCSEEPSLLGLGEYLQIAARKPYKVSPVGNESPIFG
ncbi:MAG: methyltransferase domain-containing protein [Deltaproteobacteria bacterium]|nr:methyltransferase domain-containing protein [Deltaproteobacteria bacterium]